MDLRYSLNSVFNLFPLLFFLKAKPYSVSSKLSGKYVILSGYSDLKDSAFASSIKNPSNSSIIKPSKRSKVMSFSTSSDLGKLSLVNSSKFEPFNTPNFSPSRSDSVS